ncbi:mechanosensitive ion channel [Endozoicomonas sp. SM1973]|uniref:Mechanosensitive ion channel n=1 Tax=Spartinivicinus marinus TaxID=2994442 RepID=A0A853I266_9GAMM|nr:mechanosensitive ion channel domain-containing protein [Spartinivicinus marinus]MCX4029837.1 mechanosensitive ion channel [Spartinivicinus marinus]NYZ67493.1 mechanosensitive ion channel [Spartinivicinus marinus]
MRKEALLDLINSTLSKVIDTVSRIETYSEIAVIILIYTLAYMLASRLRKHIPIFKQRPSPPESFPIHDLFFRFGKLLFPLFAILLLRLTLEFSQLVLEDGWVMQFALVAAILLLFNSFVSLVITHKLVAQVFRWIGLPILFLHLVGILDDIILVLESIAIKVGNINLSAYGLVRVILFGSLLFWLGRVSNSTGQTLIRKQQSLDFRTREVLAKLFEIALFFIIFLLMLQVMGINLTALAVFGGAVGVGLGFGLQAIASNFISGVIILLDRSVSVGDYVELEDGRTGVVTQLNMRSTTLETFDGKDIVVPNEKFITSSFTNWTHKNTKQRYRVDFSVAYKTDVRHMVELVKTAVAEHPQVISGDNIPFEERPDCEIDSFGDSGINMFVEFWMEGIDDGRNRVGGDLLLIILETLQKNGIEIPFPQREVRILSDNWR